mgnify:CR=1 FL=1
MKESNRVDIRLPGARRAALRALVDLDRPIPFRLSAYAEAQLARERASAVLGDATPRCASSMLECERSES